MPTVTWARVDPARRAAVVPGCGGMSSGAHGFSGGSLNVIARRAGVAKGSLFHPFATSATCSRTSPMSSASGYGCTWKSASANSIRAARSSIS